MTLSAAAATPYKYNGDQLNLAQSGEVSVPLEDLWKFTSVNVIVKQVNTRALAHVCSVQHCVAVFVAAASVLC